MKPDLAAALLRLLRRSWQGAELCRARLEESHENAEQLDVGSALGPIVLAHKLEMHDVEWYAWETIRICNISNKTIKAGLRGNERVRAALDSLHDGAPELLKYRNSVTHPEDNRFADDLAYFGTEVVRLIPGGDVVDVLDLHTVQPLLKEVVLAAEVALMTVDPEVTPDV